VRCHWIVQYLLFVLCDGLTQTETCSQAERQFNLCFVSSMMLPFIASTQQQQQTPFPKTHCVCNSLLSAASSQLYQAADFQLSHTYINNRQPIGCCRIGLLKYRWCGTDSRSLSSQFMVHLSKFTSHRRGQCSIWSIPCGIFSWQSGRHSHRFVWGQLQPHPLFSEDGWWAGRLQSLQA